MPFPTNTTVLDTFNRADSSNPGANYSGFFGDPTAIQIISNTAAGDNNGFWSGSYWNPANFGPDIEFYIDVPALGSNRSLALTSRATGTLNSTPSGYALFVTLSTGVWKFNRLDSGVETQLGATFSQAISAGDSIGYSIIGSTLTAYYKASGGSWTAIGTRTDTTYTAAGKFAIEMEHSTTHIDNFSGGTVVTGGGGPIWGRSQVLRRLWNM